MNAVNEWAERLRNVSRGKRWGFVNGSDLAAFMGPTEGLPPEILQARAQKAAMVWLKTKLVADLSFNQNFEDKTDIVWVDKLLKAARVKELASVKIGKAKKSGGLRYDVTGMQGSWYGRRILDSCGFGRRRTSLERSEFDTVVAACSRIGLTLPQTVSPTTTERFFAGEEI